MNISGTNIDPQAVEDVIANASGRYELVLTRRLADPLIYWPQKALTSPTVIYAMFGDWSLACDREHFVVLCLDSKNRITGYHVVSVGSLSASLVHPREVLKAVILSNSAAMILMHNHPSGDPEPSSEDFKVTHKMYKAGQAIGIPVLDHVIVAERGYYSFSEHGQLQAEG